MNTRCWLPCFVLFLWSFAHAAVHADTITLDRQSNVAITCTGPAAQEMTLARDLLSRYLLLALGKDELTGSGPAVQFALHAQGLTWRDLPMPLNLRELDAFTVRVSESPAEVRIEAGTVLGLCYGVIHFLENDLGVTWLFPGDLGLALSSVQQFQLKPGERRVQPAIVSRFYTGMKFADPAQMPAFRQQFGRGPLYEQRHFFESHDYFKSLKLHGLLMPSHNMINIFPPQRMMAEHPDVMPMLADGARYQPPAPRDDRPNDHQHWHPCYTSPTTRQIAIDAARAAFERGTMCFSLGINDGLRQQCQCEACRAVGWPASYYQFVSAVADGLKDRYPPQMVGVLVYGDVRHPSEDLRLPENVFTLVSMGSAVQPWARRAVNLGRYEYIYGRGFGIPSFTLKSMAHNASAYERLGVQSVRAEAHPVWAFDAPKIFIHTRLFWDPQADPQALLRRWCDAAFGDGGDAIARLYLHWAAKFDYLVKPGSDEPAPLVDMGVWRSSAAQYAMTSADDYVKTFALLDEAASRLTTPAQRERLDMLRTHFELSRAESGIHHRVQTLFDGSSDLAPHESLAVLSDLARQREQAGTRIEEHPQWTLAGGSIRDRPGWSLEKQMQSGLVTTMVSLHRAGKLTPAMIAAVPPEYRVYGCETSPLPVSRFKVLTSGTYWALETSKPRFKPMAVEIADGVVKVTSDGVNDRVTEGALAGEYREHWAMVLVPTKRLQRRLLYEVTMQATARGGVLSLQLDAPWRTGKGDGLPVGATVAFNAASRTVERRIIVEPVGPESQFFDKSFQMRVGLLWSPDDDDAKCEARVSVTPLELIEQP